MTDPKNPLPVVAWMRRHDDGHENVIAETNLRQRQPKWVQDDWGICPTLQGLTPHAPAQAAIDELQADLAKMTERRDNLHNALHSERDRMDAFVERLTRERDALKSAGAPMANTMFNLAQFPGRVLTEDECKTFKSMQVKWDAAMSTNNLPGEGEKL